MATDNARDPNGPMMQVDFGKVSNNVEGLLGLISDQLELLFLEMQSEYVQGGEATQRRARLMAQVEAKRKAFRFQE